MKILTFGDNPKTSTGYGQIWDNLLKRWTKLRPDWKFYHVGWQNWDRPHQTKDGYFILPRGGDDYGADVLLENLMTYKPNYFITLCDVGIQSSYVDSFFEAKKRGYKGKWIAYLPIDNESWEYLLWNKILECPDLNVGMSKWSAESMRNHGVQRVKYIPLGVDIEEFNILKEREIIRKNYGLSNHFVVGFVGRNQRRKMIAHLIKGFSQFSKGKDDVKLLLHTDAVPSKKYLGWLMDSLNAKAEAEQDSDIVKFQKIQLTKSNLGPGMRQRIQAKSMNEIYNMMDIFCYATGGEGFGLPGLECQSAGIPLMMTHTSSCDELTGNGTHGIIIPVLEDKYRRLVTEIGANGIENAVPDDKEIARLLEIYYNDWKSGKKILKEKSKQARRFALKYNWDKIARQWINLFEEEYGK